MPNVSNHTLVELAEKLYVYEHATCVEIARKTGKNRRTIETWKSKYRWEEKRTGLLESQRALPQKLFEHYNVIMDSICDDIKNNRDVSASKYRLAAMLFEQIPKAKEVEQAAVAEKEIKDIPVEKITKAVLRALSPDYENETADEK